MKLKIVKMVSKIFLILCDDISNKVYLCKPKNNYSKEEACHDFEPLIVIAPRVNRSLRYLKNKVIPDMVAAGMLIRKYPTVPNHPDQQYKSNH